MGASLSWLATTVVVLIFALLEWWTEKKVSDYSRAATTAIELAIVLAATLAFRPIHQRVDRGVEAMLSRRQRRAREQLYKLTRELPSFSDSAQLMRRVLEGVDHYLHAGGSAIYLRANEYSAAASTFDSGLEPVEPDDPLVIRLRSSSTPANPRTLGSQALGSIACPMMAGGELIGFLVVASRKEDYEPEDGQILAGLAESAGIALTLLDPKLAQRSDSKAQRGNLPVEVASFIGRRDDVAAVCQLLDTHRLLCLKGPGGIGKSRLALRAAHEYRARAPQDAAWFVDLSPAARAGEVVSLIAKAIGVPQTKEQTELQNVTAFLEPRSALIVLDNCEHLIQSAAEICSQLLARCARLRLIATSRERLAISGEAVYTVPPLEPEQSLTLFRERAAEVGANLGGANNALPDVMTILGHLDGLPYAIELAAARLRLMSPHELAAGIGNRLQLISAQNRVAAPRQQTLRAMIDWSYCLLSAQEQLLFRRLAVFPYEFGLSAAAAICGAAPLCESEVVALTGALVDKSLLQTAAGPDGQRFHLLESTRAYASELCEGAGLADLKRRHAQYFADMVSPLADPNVIESDARMRQAHTDIDNIYAAMDWGLAQGDVHATVRIAASLRLFWFHYAQLRTGREWLTRILEREADLTPEERASMHIGRAIVSEFSDPVASVRSAELAVAVYRNSNEQASLAQSLTVRGIAQRSLGLYNEARASYEESMAIYERLGSERADTVAGTLAALLTDCCPDEFELAQRLYARCLLSVRRIGKRGVEGVMLGNLAQLALLQGDNESAYALSRQSVDMTRALGAIPVVATFLPVFASAAHATGHRDEAHAALCEALSLFAEIGDDDPEHMSAALDAAIEYLTIERQYTRAAEIYRTAQAYRRRHNVARVPTTQARFDAIVAPLLPFVGDSHAHADAAHASPSTREAVSLALETLSSADAPEGA